MGDFNVNKLVSEVPSIYEGKFNPNPNRQPVYIESDGKKTDSVEKQIEDSPAVILDLTEAGRAHLEAFRREENDLGKAK